MKTIKKIFCTFLLEVNFPVETIKYLVLGKYIIRDSTDEKYFESVYKKINEIETSSRKSKNVMLN